MTAESSPDLPARAAAALALPIAAAADARLLDPADPSAGVRATATGATGNGVGGMHASALAALLEAAGFLAVLPHLAAEEHAVTHAVTLHLLAPVALGSTVLTRGSLDRRTRRLAFVTAWAESAGEVVARAQLVKSVVAVRPQPRPGPSPAKTRS